MPEDYIIVPAIECVRENLARSFTVLSQLVHGLKCLYSATIVLLVSTPSNQVNNIDMGISYSL
jgi:hypothetical protein